MINTFSKTSAEGPCERGIGVQKRRACATRRSAQKKKDTFQRKDYSHQGTFASSSADKKRRYCSEERLFAPGNICFVFGRPKKLFKENTSRIKEYLRRIRETRACARRSTTQKKTRHLTEERPLPGLTSRKVTQDKKMSRCHLPRVVYHQ